MAEKRDNARERDTRLLDFTERLGIGPLESVTKPGLSWKLYDQHASYYRLQWQGGGEPGIALILYHYY